MGIPTDTNATIQQQMNRVFCVVRAEVLEAGQLKQWVSLRQLSPGKNVSTEVDDIVEIRHQATTDEDTADWEGLSVCCSELQFVN
jgi:hypothetical protein